MKADRISILQWDVDELINGMYVIREHWTGFVLSYAQAVEGADVLANAISPLTAWTFAFSQWNGTGYVT
jgi:hypothetical protein